MILGRITAKAQTTIARAVRLAFGLSPGDDIVWEIEGDQVILTKANAAADPFVGNFDSFTEWAGEPNAKRLVISKRAISSGDIVWVPFAFVQAPRLPHRPALVISVVSPTDDVQLLWVLMITSAAHRGWLGDVSLETRFAECGLEVPCVVRTAKVSTVESQRARVAGRLPHDLCEAVQAHILQSIA